MHKRPLFLCFILVFFGLEGLFSLDYGGILSQSLKLENSSTDKANADPGYSLQLAPWASLVLPNNMFLYLSVSAAVQYDEPEKWKPLFEAGRFELTWRPRPYIFVEAGRFSYTDPAGMVADGLFDGAAASLGLEKNRLSLGAYYTGLLYKKTANIIMTSRDALDYTDPDRYFAPPRFFLSAFYAMPGLISWRDALTAGLIIQFDLRDEEHTKLHSQYAAVQYLWNPLDVLAFNLGGAFGLVQKEDADLEYNYALSVRGDWAPPTKMNGQLSLRFRYASGLADNNDAQGAFTPITNMSQSGVFSANFSGLMALSGIFTLRPLEKLSVAAETNFLMRTDLASFAAEGLNPASKSHLLGPEICLSLVWTPFSDLGLNAGGGLFFPLRDGAFYDDAPPKWNISLGVIFSF